jgi:hypothetical protein
MKKRYWAFLIGSWCLSVGMQAAKVDTLSVHSDAMNKEVQVITICPDKAMAGEKNRDQQGPFNGNISPLPRTSYPTPGMAGIKNIVQSKDNIIMEIATFAVFNVSGYGNMGVGWTLDGVNFLGGTLRMLFPFSLGMLMSRTGTQRCWDCRYSVLSHR